MPTVDEKYIAPVWQDNAPPAINAEELQAISDACERADSNFTREELLKAETAALFGLPNTAVPDDVLAWLGKYNEYWWERHDYVIETKESGLNYSHTAVYSNESSRNISYSSALDIDPITLQVTLKNPSAVTIQKNLSGATTLASKAPCYIKNAAQYPNNIYYLQPGATSGTNYDSTVYYDSGVMLSSRPTGAAVVIIDNQAVRVIRPEFTLVHSTNANAYPESGAVGGYYYVRIGKPFERFPTAPRVQTGSYVGTGTYGQGNESSLTFDFAPRLIFMHTYSTRDYNTIPQYYIWAQGAPICASDWSGYDNYVTWNGKTVIWYSDSATHQFNESGVTYHYAAIG